MTKKLFLTSSTRQEDKNGKRPHGAFIMLLLFALLLNSQNSFSQTYNFTNDEEGFTDNVKNLTVSHNSSGYLDLTTNGGGDPYVYNTSANFSSDGITHLHIRVKNGTNHANYFVYVNTDVANFLFPFSTTKNATEFQELSFELSTRASSGQTWADGITVNSVRIDPNGNGAAGTISTDYIYFTNSATLSSSNAQVNDIQTALYPNPVKKGQDVNIRLANTNNQQYKHIAVYDLQGKSVINRILDINESPKLSTNQLSKGIYFVHLGVEDSSEVFKLIVD